jgi:phycobilisome core-membrane linker protein
MWAIGLKSASPATQWKILMRTRGRQATSPSTSTFVPISSKKADSTKSNTADAQLRAALPIGKAEGYRLRSGLPTTPTLRRPFDESDLRQVVDATYQQLLNKVPLEQQRMVVAESKLRDGQIDLAGFVEAVALGDGFQERLFCMAPLRAATAASLALLGRASTPSETSRFLRIRFESGQPAAVSDFLAQRNTTTESSSAPGLDGMNTQQGVPQETITRTASLYRGPAGMTPPPQKAL